MSTSRYVSRHGSSRRSPFARLGGLPTSVSANGARAAAKTVAGVGIVLGSGAFVIAPSSAADTSSSTDLAAISADSATVTELLGDRAGDPAASRSTSRTAVAVTAPSGTKAKDVHDTAGALAIDPVVKPKPKPKPKPEPVEKPVDEPDTTAAPQASESQAPERTSRSSQRESVQPESSAPEPTQAPSSSVDTSNYASQGAALGLGPNAQRVYSAVRTQFPDMTNIGGFRAGDPGDHGSGNAVDIMVTGSRGDQINAWLQQNAGSLNIKYIIWQQRIWFPGGSSKMMADRGSPTQNHYDHVHVSVN